MPEDPLEALAHAAAEGSKSSFRSRIDKERKTQKRSRMTRWTLRWSILVLAPLSFALAYFGEGGWQALAALGFFITLLMMGALFLMGGIASPSVRVRLSNRERKMLDD